MSIIHQTRAFSISLVTALSIALTASPSKAEDKLYVSIASGVNIAAGNSDFTNNQTNLDTDFDTGFLIGGAVGYKAKSLAFGSFSPRTELEVTYSRNSVGALDFSGNGVGAENVARGSHVSALSVFANIFVDGDDLLGKGITPYVGGGVGFSRTSFDLFYNAGNLNLNDTSTSFAWHITGGVKYALSDQVSLFTDVGYRQIVNAGSIRRANNNVLAGPGGGNFEDNINNVAVRLGVTYSF